jgi:hypothetical protein
MLVVLRQESRVAIMVVELRPQQALIGRVLEEEALLIFVAVEQP